MVCAGCDMGQGGNEDIWEPNGVCLCAGTRRSRRVLVAHPHRIISPRRLARLAPSRASVDRAIALSRWIALARPGGHQPTALRTRAVGICMALLVKIPHSGARAYYIVPTRVQHARRPKPGLEKPPRLSEIDRAMPRAGLVRPGPPYKSERPLNAITRQLGARAETRPRRPVPNS